MSICVAIVVTCWLAVLIVTPRKPRWGNEVEELVYARLLGRQHLLAIVAALITAASVLAVVVMLPQRIDPTLGAARQLNQYCAAAAAGLPLCYRLERDGRWLEAMRQSDGQWVVVRTVLAPPMEPALR